MTPVSVLKQAARGERSAPPQAGLRVVNGWQNSGLPWSTKMNPAKMYRLDKH